MTRRPDLDVEAIRAYTDAVLHSRTAYRLGKVTTPKAVDHNYRRAIRAQWMRQYRAARKEAS